MFENFFILKYGTATPCLAAPLSNSCRACRTGGAAHGLAHSAASDA